MPLRASGFVGQPAAADPPPRPRPPRVSLFFSVSLSPSKKPRSVPLSKWQRGREWRSRRGGLRTGAEDAAERRGKSRGEAISRNKPEQKNGTAAMRRAEARREGQTEQATRPADKSRKPRDKGEDLAGRSEDPPPRTRGRMLPRERFRAPNKPRARALFPSCFLPPRCVARFSE